ncbi:MAG: redoxin domain-containing protein [Planctomycetota bacterium]
MRILTSTCCALLLGASVAQAQEPTPVETPVQEPRPIEEVPEEVPIPLPVEGGEEKPATGEQGSGQKPEPKPEDKPKKKPELVLGERMSREFVEAVAEIQLTDIDGNSLNPRSLANKILVVNFWATRCPVQLGWEGRLKELVESYGEREDVVFLMVNSNVANGELLRDGVARRMRVEPTEEEMKKAFPEIRAHLREHELPYRVLVDTQSKLARLMGAQTTPDIYVFDQRRTFVYRGSIDDDQRGENVEVEYLKDVLDTLLDEEKELEPFQTPSVGCSIKFAPKPKKRQDDGPGIIRRGE